MSLDDFMVFFDISKWLLLDELDKILKVTEHVSMISVQMSSEAITPYFYQIIMKNE